MKEFLQSANSVVQNPSKDMYAEGKHFICLVEKDLKTFRENHDLPANFNKLYLWTEKGTFLHAKSLNTDTAQEEILVRPDPRLYSETTV